MNRHQTCVPRWFLLIAYFCTATALLVINIDKLSAFQLVDNDDYMRLQQVRDWLDGQAWADVHQYRLQSEEGGDMHFSRLLDAPMAAMILAAKPFLGERGAEFFMLALFPLLLLFACFWTATHAAALFGGRRAAYAGVLITACAYTVLWQFVPGRIDHHGAQMILIFCALFAVVRSFDAPKWAFAAAASCVFMMAIGMEVIHFVVATALGVGLPWLTKRRTAPLFYFGSGLVLLSFTVMFLEKAGGAPMKVYCDAYTPPYALGVFMSGLGALALYWLSPRLNTIRARAIAAAIAGAAAVGVTVAIYPQCLAAGPYSSLAPEDIEAWFLYGRAAKDMVSVFQREGFEAFSIYIIPLIALVICVDLIRTRTGDERLKVVILTGFVALPFLITIWQLRGAPFAHAMAILPPAIMLGQMRDRIKAPSPRALSRLVGRGLWITPLPYLALSLAAVYAKLEAGEHANPELATVQTKLECQTFEHVEALRQLPTGLFINHFDIGPEIIAMTDHSVTAAFYHRNLGTMVKSKLFFDGPSGEAYCTLRDLAADYVVFCPSGVITGSDDPAEATLSERLINGDTPDWLDEIDVEGAAPLRIFKPDLNKADLSVCGDVD